MDRRPLRLTRFSYKGAHRYSLTWCTRRRARVFTHPMRVAIATEQIQRTADECWFALLAYCFMPDHLHLLVEGLADDADLRVFVNRGRRRVGCAIAAERRLWQDGCYERVLRDSEPTRRVAAYIVSYPVRAGLARRIGEYRFAGCPLVGASLEDLARG